MKMQRKFWCVAVVLAAAGVVWAQDAAKHQSAPVSSIQVDANLVIVPVTVRDKKGELLKGLTKENFSLQSGGKDQAIRYFDNDSNQPITFGLLVDVSRNMQSALGEEKQASQAFIDAMLAQKGDKAFVLHFAHDIELLQDVTDDRTRLTKAVRELGSESPTFKTTTDEGIKDSEERVVHGHGTSLYDAVFLAGDEILQAQKGRKALVLIANGIDGGSKEGLTDAIESAQRGNVALYAIYIKPTTTPQKWQNGQQTPTRSGNPGGYPGSRVPNTNPNDPNNQACQTNPNDPNCPSNPNRGQPRKSYVDGKQVLERMCGETGGHVFEVSKKLSVEQIYAQIADELRTQYLIGFTPDAAEAKSGYHRLDLRMTGTYDEQQKSRKIDVQARDGYYIAER
jgi:VWFA-related protein